MAQETIYKTVYQYNKEPISVRDMARRLRKIAEKFAILCMTGMEV